MIFRVQPEIINSRRLRKNFAPTWIISLLAAAFCCAFCSATPGFADASFGSYGPYLTVAQAGQERINPGVIVQPGTMLQPGTSLQPGTVFQPGPLLPRPMRGPSSGSGSFAQPARPLQSESFMQQNTTPQGTPIDLGEPITLNDSSTEQSRHQAAKTLQLSTVYLSRAIEMHSFDALRQETSISQLITLPEAINYVLDHGMQIKITRESMNYQKYLTLAGIAGFVPSFSTSYSVQQANVNNLQTTSVGRSFVAGVNFPVFQGGAVLYSLLTQKFRERAWRNVYKGTVSDVFLDVYQKYTNLLLQRVLLQTWAKTIEADEEQLRIYQKEFQHDIGTKYAVMQADAQLAADKQSFLQQAVAMRQAGLALNLALNFPLSVNLVPAEETLTEAEIFKDTVSLRTLLADTMKFNPGLRQYEYFRLAATRNIQAQASSFYPTVSFFVLYELNNATVNPVQNGFALGGAATSAIANFLDSSFAGRVSNNALGQLYSFSPTAGATATQGANTGPSATPAALGGTPLAVIQSGSLVSSGAVAPSIFGGGQGSGSGPNVNGSLQAPAGIFPGFFSEVQAGFAMSWNFSGLGLQTGASVAQAKILARQALMQCNQEISLVAEQVRTDYLGVLAARQAIDKAAATALAYQKAVQVANKRYDVGAGTQLDQLQAQKNYVTAVTGQAQAIVASNVAQAQLLHDMGIINATTLTSGYEPGQFAEPLPTGKKKPIN